jgi:hypothetical protein
MDATQQTLRTLAKLGFVAVALPPGLLSFGNNLGWHAPQRQIIVILVVAGELASIELGRVIHDPALAAWLKCGGRYELWAWKGKMKRARGESSLDRRLIGLRDLPGKGRA